MEKKYEWSASISAPREYPVEVYTGAAGGYFFSQMGGFSNTGWGEGVGDNNIQAPLPERLDMTWLSYVDNKFYTGEWELPMEKIQQLFDEGFYSKNGDDNNREPYRFINIGLAPKGMVVVWVTGVGRQVEVARYQAHETIIDPKLISESEKYMFANDYSERRLKNDFVISKHVREQIEQYGYPSPDVYEMYRKKYMWKPKVILPTGSEVTSFYIKMCNGEIEDPYDRPIDQKERAIPFAFEIFWKIVVGKKEQEFVSRIAFTNDKKYWDVFFENNGSDPIPVDFDKNQIIGLFNNSIDKNKFTDLVIKLDPLDASNKNWSVDMYLEQSGKKNNINQISHDTGKYK